MNQRRKMVIAGTMIMFWAIFDGILAYLIPIWITKIGFSKTQIGLLVASSNVFGIIFDFLLARFISNTHYRRLYLILYGLCAAYPLILWQAKTVPLFMVAMAVWGLYGDLHDFGTFDLVSRQSTKKERAQNWGIIEVFKSLGFLIAPIIGGAVVTKTIDFFPFSLSLTFIIFSFVAYLVLVKMSATQVNFRTAAVVRYNFFKEFRLLSKIAKILLPVIIFTVTLCIFDGMVWTIGPLISQEYPQVRDFGGWFMSAYTLPALIVNWLVGTISKRWGKKRTAYFSFLISCVLIAPIAVSRSPVAIVGIMFVASMAGCLAWPAIKGAYVDYISEAQKYEREIESIYDLANNLGHIIGPAVAGWAADMLGIRGAFGVMGIFCAGIVLIAWSITPRKITVRVNDKIC